MVTMTVHLRQDLAEWHLSAVVTEHHGDGIEPTKATAVWTSPLTGPEWDLDALAAALLALRRWSELTTDDLLRNR
jgi:hypothetical protein